MNSKTRFATLCAAEKAVSLMNHGGLNIKEVASHAKVSRQTVSKWLRDAGYVKVNKQYVTR